MVDITTLAEMCHFAQEHVSDPQAWDHNGLEVYMTCVDYQIACFLSHNTAFGRRGVECGVVMDELCSMPPLSIEEWKAVIDQKVEDYGGWEPFPSIRDWGKDHWSTFAYVGTRCVDYGGRLDTQHMRRRNKEYPTRMKGGKTIPLHSDMDCVSDMEDEKLLINEGTGIEPVCRLTKKGWAILSELQQHKSASHSFATFVPSEDALSV